MYYSLCIYSIKALLIPLYLLLLFLRPMFIDLLSFEFQHAQQIIATRMKKKMATPKQLPKAHEESREINNCLMTDFFKRGRPGCPKKTGTLNSEKLDVRSEPPPSKPNQ